MRRLVFEHDQDNDIPVAQVVYSPCCIPCKQADRTRPPRRRPSTHFAPERIGSQRQALEEDLSKGYKFIYRPLPGDGYIRRLILEPGKGDDNLVGRLEVVSLACAHGSFEAISYAWGSDEKNHIININGKPMAITTSLRDALHQTRRSDKPRVLWADAICINQQDTQEKGHQVALMGEVYKSSCCTLICLGYSTESWPREVATLIQDVEGMMDRVMKFYLVNHKGWDSFPYPKAGDRLLSRERWESWTELVSQPWFSRGWVVQEAALGPESLVLWAGETIPWVSLLRVQHWLNKRSHHLIGGHPNELSVLSPLHTNTLEVRRHHDIQTLLPARRTALTTLQALHDARDLELKDPKDRIYAFMAYPTSDAAMPALRPNYTDDTSHLDLYWEFAVKYLERTLDLNILAFVEHEKGDEVASTTDAGLYLGPMRSLSCPSWVPRWDRGRGLIPLWHWAEPKVNGSLQKMIFSNSNATLQVKAVIFDSVEYVSEEIKWKRHYGEAVASVIRLWRNIAEQSIRYPGPHQSNLNLAFLGALNSNRSVGDRDEWDRAQEAFAKLLPSGIDNPELPVDRFEHNRDAKLLSKFILDFSHGRRLLVLGRGHLGQSSSATHVGDVCAAIFGSSTPFILRKMAGREDHFSVVGPAYIQSAEVYDNGAPIGMGRYGYCNDWEDWNLPTRDLFLV